MNEDAPPPTTGPPQGWQVVASAVPGIEVWAPIPDDPSRLDAPEAGYRCPACAGTMAFDAEHVALICGQCGHRAETEADGDTANRRRFTPQAIAEASQTWQLDRRDLHCDGCGVDLAVDEGSLVAQCPFCGSNQVLLRPGAVRGLRPSAVVPFSVSGEGLRTQVQAWLGRGWLHPADLAQAASIQNFTGIYLPFWLFDARCRAAWKAEVGTSRTRTVHRGGKRQVQHYIDWNWRTGRVALALDDRLQPGTEQVPPGLLQAAQPYDLTALAPYRPDFLAGWQALTYDVGLTEAWDAARARMRDEVRSACRRDTRGDHVRHLTVEADFDEEQWRYVLLPMHLCAYRYGGKTWRVAVNGQTGQVVGAKPVVWARVWLTVGGMFVPGTLVGLLGLVLLIVGIGVFFLVLALILLVAGGLGAIALVKHASHLEDPQ